MDSKSLICFLRKLIFCSAELISIFSVVSSSFAFSNSPSKSWSLFSILFLSSDFNFNSFSKIKISSFKFSSSLTLSVFSFSRLLRSLINILSLSFDLIERLSKCLISFFTVNPAISLALTSSLRLSILMPSPLISICFELNSDSSRSNSFCFSILTFLYSDNFFLLINKFWLSIFLFLPAIINPSGENITPSSVIIFTSGKKPVRRIYSIISLLLLQ